MFVTVQGKVDIYDQHCVIPVATDANNNNSWQTIYKAIDEN